MQTRGTGEGAGRADGQVSSKEAGRGGSDRRAALAHTPAKFVWGVVPKKDGEGRVKSLEIGSRRTAAPPFATQSRNRKSGFGRGAQA
jgi:hypothetical protein